MNEENESEIRETMGFIRSIVKLFIYSLFIFILIIIIALYLPRALVELGL